jgi:hypothetical protein
MPTRRDWQRYARKGSTAQRGYGGDHQRLRAQWKPTVDAGQAYCHAVICLKPARHITPGTPWHLGHTPDRTAWTGPEHEQCNESEAARRGNRQRGRQARTWRTSRQW